MMDDKTKAKLAGQMRRVAREILDAADTIERSMSTYRPLPPPSLPPDTLVTACGLSVRTRRCLIRLVGPHATLADVGRLAREDLTGIRGVGKIALREIRGKLAEAGLRSAGEYGQDLEERGTT
jgi:hypothetical protein